MKLILQIALGVLIGILASQLITDSWHAHQENIANSAEEKLRVEREKVRMEHGERIRKLLLESRQGNTPNSKKPPTGFIPDDARVP